MPAKGQKQTEKSKQKIRQALLGHKVSRKVRKKISNALKKNPVKFWKGKKFSEKHRENLSNSHKGLRPWNSGSKNYRWFGDKVGYNGLHAWVRRTLGTPNLCEHCKTTTVKKYEWANKSRKYKRSADDWIRLCHSCHLKYDYTFARREKMRLVAIKQNRSCSGKFIKKYV